MKTFNLISVLDVYKNLDAQCQLEITAIVFQKLPALAAIEGLDQAVIRIANLGCFSFELNVVKGKEIWDVSYESSESTLELKIGVAA